MPPTRTIPPAKAIKTERTHEENQERAYIAASRRSDRSLEARVESARRASEIHKRRTGRSLRVTEQDVINEEMYEEEDDDLPLHYRRLTAHLQTGSVDFNRRLAAYLTNQVAMRSAMDQMINSSFAQQYPNAPSFAHNSMNSTFPSPMINHQAAVRSPNTSYRAAPYPSPHHPNFRQMHMRANSVATSNELTNSPHGAAQSSPVLNASALDARRMSMPTSSSSTPMIKSPLNTADIKPDPEHQRHTQSASTMHPAQAGFPLWQDHGMFTMSLPPESQQLLAPALDPNDPFAASLMAGSEQFMSNPHYPWSGPHDSKGHAMASPVGFGGMSATLAPSALDVNQQSPPAASSGQLFDANAAPSTGLDLPLSQDSNNSKAASAGVAPALHDNGGLASGQLTPGEGFWDSFVQDGGWGDDTAAAG